MSRHYLAKCLLVIGTLLVPTVATAQLQTKGAGKKERIDETTLPAKWKQAYTLFSEKCTQCHAMARPIAALKSGRTPVSGGKFDNSGIKKYVVKMMRKPNSGIRKRDAKQIIQLLKFLRGLAEKGEDA